MPSVNEKKYYWLLRTCSMPKMQLYVISTLFVSIFSESEQMWKGSWRELNLVIADFLFTSAVGRQHDWWKTQHSHYGFHLAY